MAKKKYQSKKKAEQPIKKVNVLTKPTSSLFEWKWFDKKCSIYFTCTWSQTLDIYGDS